MEESSQDQKSKSDRRSILGQLNKVAELGMYAVKVISEKMMLAELTL